MPRALRAALRSTDFPFFVQMDRMDEFACATRRIARTAIDDSVVYGLCTEFRPFLIVADRGGVVRGMYGRFAKCVGNNPQCCHIYRAIRLFLL